MEESYFKISFAKVLELVLNEERQKIKSFYMGVLGKPTADQMDSYVPTDSEILKLFTHETPPAS